MRFSSIERTHECEFKELLPYGVLHSWSRNGHLLLLSIRFPILVCTTPPKYSTHMQV